MSMWLIQNADIFILSRFVDHAELGVYHLASRLGSWSRSCRRASAWG